MKPMFKCGLAAIALAALPLASACSQVDDQDPKTATKDDGTITLAAALGAEDGMDTLQNAITNSELSGVLDGPASYTLLAPTDAAFDALGDEGKALLTDDQRPLLVGLLREHMLPGHLTPETIEKAIADKGGPVTISTLGESQVTFSMNGDQLNAALPGGATAAITGTAIAANNGVVIPLDTVLMPQKAG